MGGNLLITAALWVEVLIAVATMGYGSYTDVRRRRVNSFLFFPLVLAGFAGDVISGLPEVFIAFGVLIFAMAYLRTTGPFYAVAAASFLAYALYFTIYVDFYFGFTMVISSVVYALGYGERFFGIGDIKAILSAIYAFPYLVAFHGYSFSIRIGTIPGALIMIIVISLSSVVWASYGIYLSVRSGSHNGIPFSLAYDEEAISRKPAAFQVRERDGTRYMLYRIPFMLPIFVGFIVYLIVGSLP